VSWSRSHNAIVGEVEAPSLLAADQPAPGADPEERAAG
jgi:hypothetical protein